MTEAELKVIEVEADGDCSNCMALVAEVRRLRGLIKDVEHGPFNDGCPWCTRDYRHGKVWHKHDCPAFTPEGDVR